MSDFHPTHDHRDAASERSQAVMAIRIGAILGAFVGYLFFTDRGRRLRQQIDHALDDLARRLDRAGHALHAVVATPHEDERLFDARAVRYDPPLIASAGRMRSPSETAP